MKIIKLSYSELSEEAKINALNNYCRIFRLNSDEWKEKILFWFETINRRKLFNEKGDFWGELLMIK